MSGLPTPPLYSSGEGHGGGVGSPGSPTGGSNSHCLVVSANGHGAALNVSSQIFLCPLKSVFGVLQVKGT